jgi:hypothetical protein
VCESAKKGAKRYSNARFPDPTETEIVLGAWALELGDLVVQLLGTDLHGTRKVLYWVQLGGTRAASKPGYRRERLDFGGGDATLL